MDPIQVVCQLLSSPIERSSNDIPGTSSVSASRMPKVHFHLFALG